MEHIVNFLKSVICSHKTIHTLEYHNVRPYHLQNCITNMILNSFDENKNYDNNIPLFKKKLNQNIYIFENLRGNDNKNISTQFILKNLNLDITKVILLKKHKNAFNILNEWAINLDNDEYEFIKNFYRLDKKYCDTSTKYNYTICMNCKKILNDDLNGYKTYDEIKLLKKIYPLLKPIRCEIMKHVLNYEYKYNKNMMETESIHNKKINTTDRLS